MDGRHGEEKCSNLGPEQQAEHDGGNAMDTALDQLAAILADEDAASMDPSALAALTESEPGPAQPGRLTVLAPDRVEAEIESERGGMAVFAEAFYPGWRAFVDGRPAPIHRVNYLLRGVLVPPGRHTVSMRFEPWRYRVAVSVFWIGFLLAPGVEGVRWGLSRRRRRRRG